jgi:hypothetical protein
MSRSTARSLAAQTMIQQTGPSVSAASSALDVRRRAGSASDSASAPALPRFSGSLASLPAQPADHGLQRRSLSAVTSSAAKPVVQRKCSACDASEDKVMPRRKPGLASLLGDDDDKKAGKQDTTAVQPMLEVGPVNDPFEREADSIATHALSTPAPAPTSDTGDLGAPSIQRKCAACEAEEDSVQPRRMVQDEGIAAMLAGAAVQPHSLQARPVQAPEVQRKCAACAEEDSQSAVRAKEASPQTSATPQLAATPAALTSGGRALPDSTRSFFEDRMGRDLSHVKVHEGSESQRLNGTIDARAFTYSNHVWLGHGERADTSFTMAHELAHVLQQTQPGEVKPRRRMAATSTSRSIVQRKMPTLPGQNLGAFWLPAGVGTGRADARLNNEAKHDAAMHALANANKPMITDALIPGATGGSSNRSDISGFADFYTASPLTMVGVIKKAGIDADKYSPGKVATPSPSGAPAKADPNKSTDVPVNNFNKAVSRPPSRNAPQFVKDLFAKGPKKNPSVFNDSSPTAGFAPSVNGDVIENLDKAPKNIKIGDMKPGHNIGARQDGVKQIENYIGTVINISKIVDKYQDFKGGPKWGLAGPLTSVDSMKLTSMKMPSEWDPNSKTAGGANAEPSIELRQKNSILSFLTPGGAPAIKPKVSGRWVAAPDNKYPGIWTYFLAPDQASIDALTGSNPNVSSKFTDVNTKLQDWVLKPLQEMPKASAAPTVAAPLRRGQATPRRTALASRGNAKVRRAGPKDTPKPVDTFKAAEWEKKRFGKNKDDMDSFRGVFNKAFNIKDVDFAGDKVSAASAVEFQRGVVESLELLKDQFGVNRDVKDPERIKKDAGSLKQFEFWSSRFASVIGKLRQIFGRVFIKVWQFGAKVKAWFAEKLKKFKFKGAKAAGGLKGVAMKVGAKVLKVVGMIFVRKTTHALMQCIETGFKRTIDDIASGPMETLEGKMKEIESFVINAEAKLLGQFESMFSQIITPIKKELEDLKTSVTFIAEIVSTIKTIKNVASAAVCLAGGLETLGASCVLALLEMGMSAAGISPVDFLVEKLMESCGAQEAVGEFMAASSFIQSIPNRVAKEIMSKVRTTLPESLKGLVCKDEDFKIEAFNPKEMECKGGSGGGSGDGGDSSTPGGTGGAAKDGGTAPAKQDGGSKDGTQKGPASAPSTGTGQPNKDGDGLKLSAIELLDPNMPLNFTNQTRMQIRIIEGLPTRADILAAKAKPPGTGLIKTVTMAVFKLAEGQTSAKTWEDVPIKAVIDVELIFKDASGPQEGNIYLYSVDFTKPFRIPSLNWATGPGAITNRYKGKPN